jgi:hypothetical protein
VSARGRTRWLAASSAAFVFVLYLANLPLYAGQSFEGGFSWRMEHGRITVSQDPRTHAKPFWVDWNTESLRWSAQWRRLSPEGWVLTLPLWIPLAACLAWCGVSWRRSRQMVS